LGGILKIGSRSTRPSAVYQAIAIFAAQLVATKREAVNQDHIERLAWKLLTNRYRVTDRDAFVPIRDTS
ncbi:MAG TPA: hypothetical protein VF051_08630, partial [Hyphomicrobiaceae bacterium]